MANENDSNKIEVENTQSIAEELPTDAINEILNDQDSRGFSIATVGPNLGMLAYSVTDGDYETHVNLAAAIIGEHIEGLEADAEQYLRDVVACYNERDFFVDF